MEYKIPNIQVSRVTQGPKVLSLRADDSKDSPFKGLIRLVLAAAVLLLLCASLASAEKWSRRYIRSLPDSAFASVEITQDGKKVRHLPHHNRAGEVDIPHLKSALSRINQVKWIDPSRHAEAKAHLEDHYLEYLKGRAKPMKNTHRGRPFIDPPRIS